MDLDLTEWLQATQERRDELEQYGRSKLPGDLNERYADMDKAMIAADDSGRLLADAESYLSHEKAQAMFEFLKDDDLSAKDREIAIKDKIRIIQRLVDGLKVTSKTISNRIFVSMNRNRSTL